MGNASAHSSFHKIKALKMLEFYLEVPGGAGKLFFVALQNKTVYLL